ncbi:metallopeptidase TldD-related protein [uncultured Jatrophihabitans sp.]|uniref:metallopeptidase TldD-related protein n=1 Tax=uncultured Jatrophihabitans sp. TaxID=1610747 RepID=UPI0035CC918C
MSELAQDITDAVLAASAADGCVVVTAEHSETNLRWAANSLTTNGQMSSRSVTVISTFDRRGGTSVGVVTRSVATPDEVPELVRAAEAAGRDAEPAQDAAPLLTPAQLGGAAEVTTSWDDDAARTDVAVFDALTPQLAAAFAEWDAAGLLLYGFAEHQMTSYFVASSTGLRRRFDQPTGRLELNGKSADLVRSTWSGHHTATFADLDVPRSLDALRARLDWSRRRIELPAGRYETLLPATSVADLFVYAYWSASARDAMEGRNVFASASAPSGTRLGERLGPLPITLRSDPSYPGLECAPFEIATASSAGTQSVFDNGAPVPPARWITDGTLSELISTRAWAAESGAAPRPGVDNLIMECAGATESLDDLVAATERGLLLTSLWYIRQVDPQNLLLTGLTRDGVFLVEDGQVRGAVNNFRFNESPVDLLGRVSGAGRTEHTLSREWSDYFTRTAMPALRVPDFNMSTVSPAT